MFPNGFSSPEFWFGSSHIQPYLKGPPIFPSYLASNNQTIHPLNALFFYFYLSLSPRRNSTFSHKLTIFFFFFFFLCARVSLRACWGCRGGGGLPLGIVFFLFFFFLNF